jgi:hypothetical protein
MKLSPHSLTPEKYRVVAWVRNYDGGGGAGGLDAWTLQGFLPTDFVFSTTSIICVAPIFGGGDLTTSRTISITSAASGQDGYLSGADWITFNSKSTLSLPIAESNVTGLTSDLAGKALSSVQVVCVAPITGGGDLTTNRTISMTVATSGADGYLAQGDWSTFNAKAPTNNATFTGTTTFPGTTQIGSSGKMAIGTTISGDTLRVYGTGIRVEGLIVANFLMGPSGSMECGISYVVGTGDLTFGTNQTERFRILLNGAIGIGTTAPGYPLEVSSSFSDTTSMNTVAAIVARTGGTPQLNAFGSRLLLRSQNGVGQIVDVGYIGARISSYGADYSVLSLGNSVAGVLTEGMYIDYQGHPYFNEVLGISFVGVASTAPAIIFRSTLASYSTPIFTSGKIYTQFDGDNYPTARLTIAYPTGNNVWQDGLTLKNGKVGIGTLTPGSMLSIVGLSTTSSGLSPGDIWIDITGGLNILKIVL